MAVQKVGLKWTAIDAEVARVQIVVRFRGKAAALARCVKLRTTLLVSCSGFRPLLAKAGF